jgi:hypothetical protein
MTSATDLEHLEDLWQGQLSQRYNHYQEITADGSLALAAALVETGVDLHCLGKGVPSPSRLLLGDLCLARASRVLAESAPPELQIGFAQAIEQVAAAATGDEWGISPRTTLSNLLHRHGAGF